jgi:hypothetical protein
MYSHNVLGMFWKCLRQASQHGGHTRAVALSSRETGMAYWRTTGQVHRHKGSCGSITVGGRPARKIKAAHCVPERQKWLFAPDDSIFGQISSAVLTLSHCILYASSLAAQGSAAMAHRSVVRAMPAAARLREAWRQSEVLRQTVLHLKDEKYVA